MITVQDATGTLSGQASLDLQNTPSNFRVVATFESVGSQAQLASKMDACVTTPNTICIGVDPVHHWTSTRFGIDTGVRHEDFIQVSRAGNQEFHAGAWAEGVKAIVSRANAVSSQSHAPTAVVLQQPVVVRPLPVWPFALGVGLLALVVTIVVVWVRRREKRSQAAIDDVRREAGELAGHNIRAQEREDFEDRIDEDLGDEAKAHQIKQRLNRTYGHPHLHAAKKIAPEPSPRVLGAETRSSGAAFLSPPTIVRETVFMGNPSQGGDFTTGLLVGEALADRRDYRHRTPEPEPRRYRSDTPAPTSFSGGGDDSSPSSSSFSSGGDSSSFGGSDSGGSDSGGSDSGGSDSGGSSDSSSGGGGDSSF